MKHEDSLRIAVIGCGAIAESFHLPALAKHPDVLKHLVLVDPNTERATEIARNFGVERIAERHDEILAKIDGAVVTAPHHLHFRIARDCLNAGVHTLCEKPLAESPNEARELADLADENGIRLAVNNTRRLYPSSRRIREIIQKADLGEIHRLVIYEGEKMSWPAATGFYFGLMGSGKGVLLDRGAHVLDLICWWLGARPEIDSYYDDSFGGSEAVANISFRLGNCRGDVYLSWLSLYPNTFRIEGERGALEVGTYELASFIREDTSGRRCKVRLHSDIKAVSDFGKIIINDFLEVLRSGKEPIVNGRDVLPGLEMLDECYSRRQRFSMPWHENYEVANV